MPALLNHVKEEGYHLFFVTADDHHELVRWAIVEQKMYPILCQMGPPCEEGTDEYIEGIWYNADIDDDGFEWYFVNRDAHAMLFKLKVG